nr:MAG TPA: hypothetical protein [Caudoviricetes sp.]
MPKNAVNKPLSGLCHDFMGQKRGKNEKIEPPGANRTALFITKMYLISSSGPAPPAFL